MRIGLVVPIFNRPEYLRRSLESIASTQCAHTIYIVNDASTDSEANRLFADFNCPFAGSLKKVNLSNRNVQGCLLAGWKHFFDEGFDVLANLDSDTLVKPDWLGNLVDLHLRFPRTIITGFNTMTHPVKGAESDFCVKDTIGGINLLFGRHLFPVIEPCLDVLEWDWKLCGVMRKLGRQFIVSRPSVVQHIGDHGLTSGPGKGFPTAFDFDDKVLHDVRLKRCRTLRR
jgi:glycosyltransferase involved in cell wall biosynthesis